MINFSGSGSNPFIDAISYGNAIKNANQLSYSTQAAKDRLGALPQLLQQAIQQGNYTTSMDATKAQYLPNLMQGQINEELLRQQQARQQLSENPQLLNARLALLNAQTQSASMPGKVGQLMDTYQTLIRTRGVNDPIVQGLGNQIKLMLSGNNGQVPTQNIGTGGSQFNNQNIPGSVVGAPSGTSVSSNAFPGLGGVIPNNLQRSVGANISKWNTNNSTIYDPSTGNAINVPGTKTSDLLQSQVIGSQQGDLLANAIGGRWNILNKFMGPTNAINRFINHYIDPITKTPTSDYDIYSSTLSTTIPALVERDMQALQIPKTNKGLEAAMKMVNPQPFDTPQRFLMRVADSTSTAIGNARSAQQLLKAGIPLQYVKNNTFQHDAYRDYLYNKWSNELGANSVNSQPNTPNLTTSPSNIANNFNKATGVNVSIPDSFSSKSAFLAWKKNASPQAVQMAFQKFGGG